MYGGHITDDWDRNLCRTYLQVYMHSEMVSGRPNIAKGYQKTQLEINTLKRFERSDSKNGSCKMVT